MLTKEMADFLFKVISSWQVIAVTVVLIIYFSLVFYVARLHHSSRPIGFSLTIKPKKKRKASKVAAEVPVTSDDDLGLEE